MIKYLSIILCTITAILVCACTKFEVPETIIIASELRIQDKFPDYMQRPYYVYKEKDSDTEWAWLTDKDYVKGFDAYEEGYEYHVKIKYISPDHEKGMVDDIAPVSYEIVRIISKNKQQSNNLPGISIK